MHQKDEKIAVKFENILGALAGGEQTLGLVLRRTPLNTDVYLSLIHIYDLRPYIQEDASSDIWDDAFFSALRQAAFAQSGERLLIWFEGSSDDYSDFRDCLDDCALDENIRVKRLKTEQRDKKTGYSVSEKDTFLNKGETEKSQIVAMTTDQSCIACVPEEVHETSGLLLPPKDGIFSWKKIYPPLPAEYKQPMILDETMNVTEDTILINKIVHLKTDITLEAKVECIHCLIYIGCLLYTSRCV